MAALDQKSSLNKLIQLLILTLDDPAVTPSGFIEVKDHLTSVSNLEGREFPPVLFALLW